MKQEEILFQQRNFEQFVMSGSYAEKQDSTKQANHAKDEIRKILSSSEERFHSFEDCGMVAIFTPKEIRETNHPALTEDIFNYVRSEALSQIIGFDNKRLLEDEQMELISDFQYKPTYYAKATLNKYGKSFNYTLEEDLTGATLPQLMKAAKYYHANANRLEEYYSRCIISPFNIMPKKKLSLEIGTISKIAHPPIWDINRMLDELGEDFVLHYSKVKLSKLEEWIQIGALPADIKSLHQQVVDIRLDFSVMTIEARNRALKAFDARRKYKTV